MYYVLLLGIFLIVISVFNITPLLDIFDLFYTFRWLFGTTIFRILCAFAGILCIISAFIYW